MKENRLKLSKSRLKWIIQEEVREFLTEGVIEPERSARAQHVWVSIENEISGLNEDERAWVVQQAYSMYGPEASSGALVESSLDSPDTSITRALGLYMQYTDDPSLSGLIDWLKKIYNVAKQRVGR